jgi:heat shock protein HslJ
VRPKSLAERDCAENLAIVQQAVEKGLRRAASWAIEPGTTSPEDKLVIYSVTGSEVLRYGLDDLARLDGGEWRLVSYTVGGQPIEASDETPGLLTFRPANEAAFKRRQRGPMTGTSGCNGIVAEFYRHSDVLSFSELSLTDAPCTPALADQEAAMVDVLDSTAIRLDLPADRLILTSSDTEERLELVSQTPLEGTTWWLRRTAAEGGVGDQRVTLRLDDGVAGGEGPCGPFSADYIADGPFITFTEARGARAGDCAEQRTEQALIAGLRRTVRIERGLEELAFLDAYGAEQLVFSRPFAP